MGNERISEDFEWLASVAEPLAAKHNDVQSPEWEASRIGWIREISSSHKRGKIGEELVRAWAKREGLGVGGRGTRGHDCVIAGMRIEVKTSLRWNNERLVFLGLRDFDYDGVALLGLEPNKCCLWVVPKQILWEHAKDQMLGVSGRGSRWLSFFASNPPAWLLHWGGSLEDARRAIHEVARYGVEHERATAERESWRDLCRDIAWPWERETESG